MPVVRTVDQAVVTDLLNQLVAIDDRTDSLVKLSYQVCRVLSDDFNIKQTFKKFITHVSLVIVNLITTCRTNQNC